MNYSGPKEFICYQKTVKPGYNGHPGGFDTVHYRQVFFIYMLKF